MGIMPLPYSRTYEGFATAIYEQMKDYRFNMAYARGAVGRIKLVETGSYQFAVCSQYAAEYAMEQGCEIQIAMNFGTGSFLFQARFDSWRAVCGRHSGRNENRLRQGSLSTRMRLPRD